MNIFPEFAGFRNAHKGSRVIVCGCGESLNALKDWRPECITIGVNDVGRLFGPDYLVVLNQKNQFSRERYAYVENSRAKAVFSQCHLPLKHSKLVRFGLGKYGGTDLDDRFTLPYTRNSPYVAVCLAAYMGADYIGLLGVDFTDRHFFGETGRHPLAGAFERIDQEYRNLMLSLGEKGVRLVNLSRVSRLTGLKKVPVAEFATAGTGNRLMSDKQNLHKPNRESTMRIQIEKQNGGLVGDFLDALAISAGALGHDVVRGGASRAGGRQSVVKVVWNGRRLRNHNNVIYCEHGWLPREAYQVSHKGINADSHIAPFHWENVLLSDPERREVADYLESLRQQTEFADEYMRTDAPAVNDLPGEFILVPLQMESDTNIVNHVDSHLRRMQGVIDYISQSNPPYPVIYKQHPADARRGNGQLRLKTRRGIDRIRKHGDGNIHQILKSGACKGIVSLNSNVVHDGFLWDVPAVVLGRNIWPRSGASPFINGLPDDWNILDRFYFDSRTAACREAYIHFIMKHQWTLEDARNPEKVDALLQRKLRESESAKVVSLGAAGMEKRTVGKTVINIVARNRGWLFEDLKLHFARLRMPGIRIVPSDRPLRQADAWIFLRANEISESPDLSRTLVQIHDQFDDNYGPGGFRYAIRDCAAISFTHPAQEKVVIASGIDLKDKRILIKPLGAGGDFRLRQNLSKEFTVAWVGRPVTYKGREFKRLAWFCEALGKLNDPHDLKVILLGDRLGETAREIGRMGIACDHFPRKKHDYSRYPDFYGKMDCLVITSEFAAGPNCLFEALASGVPVIATPCGWVESLVRDGQNGYRVGSPADIATAIENIKINRETWFARRSAIQESVAELSLEQWLEENVCLAASLACQSRRLTAG
ncbi:MAG TPA: glycosyltransferase [Gammaproteobacteria bacterium]